MKKELHKSSWVVVVSGLFFGVWAGIAFGALPDECYTDDITSSRIQAVAVVEKIEAISEDKMYVVKKIIFKPERSFQLPWQSPGGSLIIKPKPTPKSRLKSNSPDSKSSEPVQTPGQLTARISELKPEYEGYPDAVLQFRVKDGERVFITVSDDGGELTSYTVMTSNLEDALNKTPEKVQAGIGQVFVKP